MITDYDAILILSFGGPEGRDEVIPFLENVLRGRNVPRERMLEVAEHYYRYDGISPINEQNRALIRTLREELNQHGPDLPVYWGNRNWHPLLPDALRQMQDEGVRHALVFVTSAMSSYSGCRQYLEDIRKASELVASDDHVQPPKMDKLRAFYNHPGFIEAMQSRVAEALAEFPSERRDKVQIIFTAHSIPSSMSAGCPYVEQFEESSRLVMQAFENNSSNLVYQSRSGPPQQPWLEPSVCDYLREIKSAGQCREVVIVPIGFVSDHMEVIFDLDTEARQLCEELDLTMVRAGTAGTHPKFISMIRELIAERVEETPRRALGKFGPRDDTCPTDCCPAKRPGPPAGKMA